MHTFIVLEGIDGVGKTTVSETMVKLGKKKGIPIIVFHTPPPGFLESAHFVNNHANTDAHFLFYLSVNKYVSDEIARVLCKTNIVCVRYFYTTFAYHLAAGLNVIVDFQSLKLVKPHFAFYLTAKEENRHKRLKSKTDKKRGDDETKQKGGFLWRVEKEFKKFPELIQVPTDNLSVEKVANNLLIRSGLLMG